jgi:hypothetical protein
MKIIDERRFTLLPKKLWKRLSKEDESNLQSYQSYYGHYKRTTEEIEELNKQIDIRKKKIDGYVNKLTNINYKIDHLRNDYNFSWSVSKQGKKDYYNLCISRRGHMPKSGGLGSVKLIMNTLREYYKKDKERLQLIETDWKRFLYREVGDVNGRLRNMILGFINDDVTLKKVTINRKTLFPIG